MQKIPMTTSGHIKLKSELKHLKSVERPSIIEQIAEARAHGDLSENAEYHAAKEKQGFIESRIQELEAKLTLAEIIDPTTLSGEKVVFGATVTIIDADTEKEKTYQIVGDDETDVKLGKLGLSSPIAKALIGKMLGDPVEIRTPGGLKEAEVIAVEFK